MNIFPSFLPPRGVNPCDTLILQMETVHKIDPCVEIQIYLAARPGGAPPGGGSGQSPPPPPPQGQCNYPSGSYGARPDYQTGRCRCKVCSKTVVPLPGPGSVCHVVHFTENGFSPRYRQIGFLAHCWSFVCRMLLKENHNVLSAEYSSYLNILFAWCVQ